MDVHATARNTVKELPEQLQAEAVTHQWAVEALNRHIDTEGQAERKILELCNEAKKQQQWFADQLASRGELARQAEQILYAVIGQLQTKVSPRSART